jgi:hypothetical protein
MLGVTDAQAAECRARAVSKKHDCFFVSSEIIVVRGKKLAGFLPERPRNCTPIFLIKVMDPRGDCDPERFSV